MLTVDSNGAIHLTRGDTARFSVSIDNLVTGTDYEITEDDVLTLTIKRRVNDSEPLVQKVADNDNVFHIKPTDTASLDFAKYLYDVQLTTSIGDVYTVIPPTTFEILKEVTW